MARRRRSRAKKQPTPDPADVLQGRVGIRPEELFALIHRANPTGRELPEAAEARRYAQKAQLQSLLVRRFGDEHLVVKPTDDDNVVSLVHRSGDRDACHAVVSELDAESRSWVRRQLDLATGEAPSEPVEPVRARSGAEPARELPADDASAATVGELLRRAREAMSEFDYEAAEKHLVRAFERSYGALEASIPLLDLWVGVLGMDAQALELERRLAAAPAEDPGVRTLLALAAARSGECERALRLVKGITLASAAEVWAALTAQAIRAGDADAAQRYLEKIGAHEPTHPEIPSLSQELAELRAAGRGPAEKTLEQRCRDAGCLAVENEARELAHRWPESEVARRILREIAAQRRAETIASALAAAEKARAADDFAAAARHFRTALDAGCERPDLPELIAACQARERQREEETQIAAIVDRLRSDDPKGALLAYLAMPESLRKQARQALDHPAPGWLEELGAPRSGSKAHAAVAAVVALAEAQDRLRQGDPQAALDELEPHAAMLAEVDDARRCLRQAGSQVRARRSSAARAVLAAARKALDDGDIEGAGKLLDEIRRGDLGTADREQAVSLLTRIRNANADRENESAYQRHLAADDLLGALELVRQLAETAAGADHGDGTGPTRWQARCTELGARLRAAWRIEENRDPLPLAEVDDVEPWDSQETPQVWLDDDGREMILATAWDRWLFLRVVDVTTATVVSRVSLRTPEELGAPEMVCRDHDRVRLVSEDGHLLELTRCGWEIVRYRSLRELIRDDAVIEYATLLPDTPYFWVESRARTRHEWTISVVDVRTWRLGRRHHGEWIMPVLTSGEPQVVFPETNHGARVFSARGRPKRDLGLPRDSNVLAAAVSPDGSGIWSVAEREFGHGDEAADGERLADGEHAMRVELWAEDGLVTVLAGAQLEAAHPMATALDQGICFILVDVGDSERELRAFTAAPSGVRELYRTPVPAGAVLVQDRHARRALAVALVEGSFRIAPLGPEPPPSGFLGNPMRDSTTDRLPRWNFPWMCGRPSEEENAIVLTHCARLRSSTPEEAIRRYERQDADDPDHGVFLCFALRKEAHGTDWRGLARRIAHRHPEHAGAAVLVAEEDADAEHWEEVHDRLAGIDPEPLGDSRASHYYHLLGLAYLHLDRPAEALAAFEKGAAYEDRCFFDSLIDLVRPFSDPPAPEEWGPDQPLVRQVVGAMRVADRALAAGELEAARAALDRSAIYRAKELFSTARLADVYLRIRVAPSDRFRKRQALALYCYVYSGEEIGPRKLDVLGLGWEKSRLKEIAERAHAWLDRE